MKLNFKFFTTIGILGFLTSGCVHSEPQNLPAAPEDIRPEVINFNAPINSDTPSNVDKYGIPISPNIVPPMPMQKYAVPEIDNRNMMMAKYAVPNIEPEKVTGDKDFSVKKYGIPNMEDRNVMTAKYAIPEINNDNGQDDNDVIMEKYAVPNIQPNKEKIFKKKLINKPMPLYALPRLEDEKE